MLTNPGGRLALEDVVGRTAEISRYWTVLRRQSLILSAERRIGKTHILVKMDQLPAPNFVPFYQELEGCHHVIELVRSLYSGVSDQLGIGAKAKSFVMKTWSTLVPKKLGQLELPQARDNWKPLLTGVMADVVASLQPNHLAVFLWDEFPLMLYNLARSEGDATAIELLDLLRHLRQRYAHHLRFVFTGSIGLHLVLRSLRAAGNANDPTNDMLNEIVPPMCPADATALGEKLLQGTACDAAAIPTISGIIATRVQGFPYYIHHIIDVLSRGGDPFDAGDVEKAILTLVRADHDPAHFGYYVDRIRTYYSPAEQELSFSILDAVAHSNTLLSFSTICNLVRHSTPAVTDESVRDCLRLLREDHYLTLTKRHAEARYGFRWKLIKAWWKENRL